MLVIGAVEIYGESIYNGLFEKPDAELERASLRCITSIASRLLQM